MKGHLLQKPFLFFFLALFITPFKYADAQWVYIPDANFRSYIDMQVPGAIDGDSMDITSDIIYLDWIDVGYSKIADLEGIEYFSSLLTLSCGGNSLAYLPQLPASVTWLDCSNNMISSYQDLPNLTDFYCWGNQMDTLPQLPSTLQHLECWSNHLQYLPQLPSSLIYLDCNTDSLHSLPDLPANLHYLDCSYNKLTALPSLSDSLQTLFCGSNTLASLPVLTPALNYIDCSSNLLTALPDFPAGLQYIECGYNDIYEIPALPDSIIELGCRNNLLTSLPLLPPSLQNLDCGSNTISPLPALPLALKILDCSNNSLSTLPTLPSSLKNLACSYNPLGVLPVLPALNTLTCNQNGLSALPMLPSSLKNLSCGSNSITTLPTLPDSLNYLYCVSIKITALPVLPLTLQTLNCSFDSSLQVLPTLPDSLQTLYCSYIPKLDSLPALPKALTTLNCTRNSLSVLPSLPSRIKYMTCSSNFLTALPLLPASLQNLDCRDNFITCLPLLPQALKQLYGSYAGYDCLPNKPAALTSIDGPDSVCSAGSPCFRFPLVTGTAYNDDNLSLHQDAGEKGHLNLIIQVQPGNYLFPITDTTGYYTYTVDTGSVYNISASPISYYTIIPGTHSTPALYADMIDSLNDFALQRIGIVHDLTVNSTSDINATRGNDMTHTITATNKGTVKEYATLQYVLDSHLTYINSSPAPGMVIGDTLQWNNIALLPGQQKQVSVILHVPQLSLSTKLNCYAIVNPIASDTMPADNIDTLYQVVVGSYDPNELEVKPAGDILQTVVANGQWMDYTIRFQNTGNATAANVEIQDTLSANVILKKLEIVASSHPMKWFVKQRVAYFDFNTINLPDSNSDERSSHGFVRYRIMADSSLVAGDVINNTAYIFFDNNTPVTTNTTTNNIVIVTGSRPFDKAGLLLYPNPVNKSLYVIGYTLYGETELTIYNAFGQLCQKLETRNPKLEINTSGLPSGVYFMQIVNQQGSWMAKFVKQ